MGTDLMGQTGSPQPSRARDPELMLSCHHQLSSTVQTSHSSGHRVRAVLPLGSRFTSKLFTSKKKKITIILSHLKRTQEIRKSSKLYFQLESGIFFPPNTKVERPMKKIFCLSIQYFIQSIGGQLKKIHNYFSIQFNFNFSISIQ